MPPPFKVDRPIVEEKPVAEEIRPVEPSLAPLSWLTLEAVAYVVVFGLGLALRWWQLSAYPLSNAETTQSLMALHLYRGNPLEGGSYSPLLMTLNTLSFFLLGPSDATARLGSVLLGGLLVALPLTLRRQLGPVVCLLATALLAFSPTALFLSRTVNSEIGAAAGALLLVSGFFNWAEDSRPRWLFLAAGGLALLLTAGPMAYSVLIVFAVIVLVKLSAFRALWHKGLNLSQPDHLALQSATDGSRPQDTPRSVTAVESEYLQASPTEPAPPLAEEDTDNSSTIHYASRPSTTLRDHLPSLRPVGLFFLVCLILLATAATFNLSGLGVTSNLFLDWLSHFRLQAQPEAGFNAVFLLTIYEPLLVVAGLAGLAYAILDRDLLKQVFAGWFVGLLILDIAMIGRPTGNVILPLVPLAFLAALALAELWQGLRQEGSWGNEGLLLAVGLVIGIFAYIGLTSWLIRSCAAEDTVCQYAWLQPIAALMLFVIVVIFFWFLTNASVAARGMALAGVGLGLMVTISIAWRLNYGPLMDLAYQPLAGIPASTELIALTDTLASESARRMGGEKTALDVAVAGVNSPALLWRLRDYRNLVVAGSLTGAMTTSAIVTPAGGELGLSLPYLGQDFALDAVWSPVGLSPQELFKWLVYRHVEARPLSNQAVLWLRVEGN
jgi:uncharacterized protein (TIGR03663 family)